MSANIITFESPAMCGKNNIIKGFRLLSESPTQFSLLEFSMELPEVSADVNYYKPEDITAQITLRGQNDREIIVNGFYFEEYCIDDNLILRDRINKAPEFRFRVSPEVAGVTEFAVSLFVKGKCVDVLCGGVDVAESQSGSKRLSVEPIRKQVFATPDGTPVPLIGINLFWSKSEIDEGALRQHYTDSSLTGEEEANIAKRFYAYHIIENLKRFAANGVNHIKIVDCVESGVTLKAKVHSMNQDVSAMYDAIFREADKLGVYITWGLLNSGDAAAYDGNFKDAKPWSVRNGGYISDSKEFFTDENTIKAVKDYFGYVVSRWGYCENIVTWEIFNGIDRNDLTWVTYGDFQKQKKWLATMREFVKSVDAYNHPVTASSFFINLISHLQEHLDIIDIQQNDANGLGMLSAIQQHSCRAYNKLSIITNTGISGPRALLAGGELTEDLLPVHQNNWCGIMGGGAGTAMNQSWKKLLDFNGEWCFKGVAKMASFIPWCDPEMQYATIESVNVSSNRIDVMGYKSNNYAYLWLFDNKLWPTCKYEEISFSNESMSMEIDNGAYTVKWLDTRTAEFINEEKITVTDGILKASMPFWCKDIAVIIK